MICYWPNRRSWGRGNKLRVLPLAAETIKLLDHYLSLERAPRTVVRPYLFLSSDGREEGA
jgi:hypothetical protein